MSSLSCDHSGGLEFCVDKFVTSLQSPKERLVCFPPMLRDLVFPGSRIDRIAVVGLVSLMRFSRQLSVPFMIRSGVCNIDGALHLHRHSP